jgi:hypothetical protein
LKPISVIAKIRQGRKASTLITNFEPFFLTADFLAEELRRICASATSGERHLRVDDIPMLSRSGIQRHPCKANHRGWRFWYRVNRFNQSRNCCCQRVYRRSGSSRRICRERKNEFGMYNGMYQALHTSVYQSWQSP